MAGVAHLLAGIKDVILGSEHDIEQRQGFIDNHTAEKTALHQRNVKTDLNFVLTTRKNLTRRTLRGMLMVRHLRGGTVTYPTTPWCNRSFSDFCALELLSSRTTHCTVTYKRNVTETISRYKIKNTPGLR